jgi:hypothetical protein
VTANKFVRTVYPNFTFNHLNHLKTSSPQDLKTFFERILSPGPAQVAERFCRALYRRHLRKKSATWHSRDQVRLEDECLKLHTSSHRAATLARFDAAMIDALDRIEDDAPREAAASRS